MIKTKKEYAAYVSNVEHFLRINHVKPDHHNRQTEEAQPFFSKSPCECCQSPLYGNRETYNFVTEGGALTLGKDRIVSADICVDCAYFLACGTLDDETMAEVAK